MVSLTRKQVEIQTREARILQLALPMVARGGLAGLSMDAIASEMEYAKGTIYNHFSCKEDVLLALAIRATETRLQLFNLAVTRDGPARDKMVGIGVACEEYRLRFTDFFRIESMVRHEAIWEKTSEQRREVMQTCEANCMGVVAGVAFEAVAAGDLQVPEGRSVQDVVFGLWSISYGGMIIDETSPGLDQIGITDTHAAIRRNCHALMDGFGWQPLYDAEADRKLVRSIRAMLKRKLPTPKEYALEDSQ
ncbi:MAG: TetR/AcrR family transcriptional regulator [Planctomycetota bacterium]